MSINDLLDKLFRCHRKELLFFASQRAGGHAEDLVQEAFIRLLQHPNPESIDNLRAFLFRTTSNLTIDHYRRQQLEARYRPGESLTDFDLDTEVSKVALQMPSLENQMYAIQELESLCHLLNELPEISRYAYVLNQVEGLTYADTAKRLGISKRSCERHVASAMRYLLKHPKFKEN